jgi:hypothetical protein
MSLEPMNRESMISLRKDYEDNLDKITKIITYIYDEVIYNAKYRDIKLYQYMIPTINNESDAYYIKYIDKILRMLKKLFPGCSVTHSILAKGKDGNLYDISKIDDNILLLIDTALNNSYIVIDWSVPSTLEPEND